jgi:hypothetical protein
MSLISGSARGGSLCRVDHPEPGHPQSIPSYFNGVARFQHAS